MADDTSAAHPGPTYAPGTQAAGPPPAAISKTLDEYTQELRDRREKYLKMGGEEAIAKQHGRHKLTARERIALLFDAGTFEEFGLLAHQHSMHVTNTQPDKTPADGVVTGSGLIDGRRVYAAAYDFTVMA